MIDIKSLTLEELQAELKKMGQPSFRAGQIFKWLHEGVKSFDEMTNISKSLREELADIAGKLKTVPADCEIIKTARLTGISFGD